MPSPLQKIYLRETPFPQSTQWLPLSGDIDLIAWEGWKSNSTSRRGYHKETSRIHGHSISYTVLSHSPVHLAL